MWPRSNLRSCPEISGDPYYYRRDEVWVTVGVMLDFADLARQLEHRQSRPDVQWRGLQLESAAAK